MPRPPLPNGASTRLPTPTWRGEVVRDGVGVRVVERAVEDDVGEERRAERAGSRGRRPVPNRAWGRHGRVLRGSGGERVFIPKYRTRAGRPARKHGCPATRGRSRVQVETRAGVLLTRNPELGTWNFGSSAPVLPPQHLQ